jgi:hypothetical protein
MTCGRVGVSAYGRIGVQVDAVDRSGRSGPVNHHAKTEDGGPDFIL